MTTAAATVSLQRPGEGAPRSDLPVLRMGARGRAVTELQRALQARGYPIADDGAFGPRTRAAVRHFQARRGLEVDGAVGRRTWAALLERAPRRAPVERIAPAAQRSSGDTKVVTGYRRGRPFSLEVASVGGGQYLAIPAAGPYRAMVEAARRDGIHLRGISGFRTLAQQAALFRRYGPGRAARPGNSNHQQGLSMDLSGVGGYRTRTYAWLRANAGRFGFVNDVRGEYWHWTYRPR